MNRISNGPVAVEVLADQLELDAQASLHLTGPAIGSNYSVAGARAYGSEAIDLATQILMFQANHGYMAPPDALYVLFIGGNDLRDARDTGDPVAARDRVRAATAEVARAVSTLAQSGARSFLVVNAPDIAMSPETRLLAAALDQPDLIKGADRLSRLYRRQMHHHVKQLVHEQGIQIIEFDLFSFFNQLIKNARHLGFTNNSDACFSAETFSFHPDCNFGLNFDDFVYFDEFHPTARVYAMVGEALFRALDKKHLENYFILPDQTLVAE